MRLARQTVRGRRRTFVSTFVALTLAVIIVTAAGVLVESGRRGDAAPDRYAGAPVVVAGQQHLANPEQDGERVRLPERVRVPVSVAEDVATVPGVRAVVVDRSVPITVAADVRAGAHAPSVAVGQGWSSAVLWPIETIGGRPPRADHEVAIDHVLAERDDLAVGDRLRITSRHGDRCYDIVGVVAPSERPMRRNLAVFFTDGVATALMADPRKADALGVLLDDGLDAEAVADEITSRLDLSVAVLTGRARGGPESLDLIERNHLLVEFGAAFGGTAAMLAAFVVAATVGMTILQRGQELALLRAVGATPRQVRRMLVGEAVVIATAAAVGGVAPGLMLGAALFGVLRDAGIVAATTPLRLGPLPVVAASATGLVVASMAAWFAGRRVARLHPTSALTEAAVEPRRLGWLRLLFGIVVVAGGLVLSVLASTMEGEQGASAVVGVLLALIIGIAALGPVLARGAGAIGGPLATFRSPISGLLAMVNLRGNARRLASASTPLALAVALTITMVGSLATEAHAAGRQGDQRLVADRIVTAPNGLPTDLVESLRAVPGVTAAVEMTTTTIGVTRRELFDETNFEMRPAVGVSTADIDRVLDLDVRAGSLSQLAATEVAVSTEIARSAGLAVGDELAVWLGDGTPLTLVVQAIYARSLGFGDLVVARETITDHLTNPMADQVLVAVDHAVDQHTVDVALAEVAAAAATVTVTDRASFRADLARAADREAATNHLFVALLAMFVTVAMVNSLVLATGERTRELALLRLLGATRSQVRAMIRRETLVLASYGTALGVAVAAATLVPFSLGIAETPIPSVPMWFVGAVIVGAILTATFATEIPTRLALRRDPTQGVSRTSR